MLPKSQDGSLVLFLQICQLQQLRYIDYQCELTQFEYLQNHHEYLTKIIKLAIWKTDVFICIILSALSLQIPVAGRASKLSLCAFMVS